MKELSIDLPWRKYTMHSTHIQCTNSYFEIYVSIYRVFHARGTQEWAYCELFLGLLRSQLASMGSQDQA